VRPQNGKLHGDYLEFGDGEEKRRKRKQSGLKPIRECGKIIMMQFKLQFRISALVSANPSARAHYHVRLKARLAKSLS